MGWGAPADRVTVVYNAVPHLERISRDEARARLNLTGIVAVSAGRLVPWKGFLALIRAAHAAHKEYPSFRLYIAGDGPERPALERLIAALGARTHITLLGALPRSELAAYLSAADLFALNTAYEGFSHQIIEALAAGLPVVTTPAGGNAEVIRDGRNGFFVPYDDEAGFRDAMFRIIRHPARTEAVKKEAACSASQFSEEAMLRQFTVLI